jgi:phosphatidylserine decarboxylase
MPRDHLTVQTSDQSRITELRQNLSSRPRLAERVDLTTELVPDTQYDVVIISEALAGSTTELASVVDHYRKLLVPSGVLSVLTLLRPGARVALNRDAMNEVASLSDGTVVRADDVLRNSNPIRVHHLRFTPAEVQTAEFLGEAYSPSSVPITRGMSIASDGIVAAAVAGGVTLLTRRLFPNSKLWLVPAIAAMPVAAFFRDPRRLVPDEANVVVAASDGTVLSVERLDDQRFGPGEWLRVAVFLSVLDVHVNRSPVAGRVVEVIDEDGGYAMAQSAAAEHNVSRYTVLETTRGRAVVAQRTGLIARRIVQRAPVGRVLARGERFGLIRFGSRTDVYLPADAVTPCVQQGDRVVGGETVLARYTS